MTCCVFVSWSALVETIGALNTLSVMYTGRERKMNERGRKRDGRKQDRPTQPLSQQEQMRFETVHFFFSTLSILVKTGTEVVGKPALTCSNIKPENEVRTTPADCLRSSSSSWRIRAFTRNSRKDSRTYKSS